MRILFDRKFSAWIPLQFWYMHVMTHFLGSDGGLADLMVFLSAQSLFAILHSRLDDILPAECVIFYLQIMYFLFPCKCFPWICLEMPRKVWLFCTSLMLLMMYALLIAEKDWWPQIAQCIHLFKHICTYTFILCH